MEMDIEEEEEEELLLLFGDGHLGTKEPEENSEILYILHPQE